MSQNKRVKGHQKTSLDPFLHSPASIRQRHRERRARRLIAADADFSAVQRGNLLRNGQPQSAAAALSIMGRIRAVEAVEQVLLVIQRNRIAHVVHTEEACVARAFQRKGDFRAERGAISVSERTAFIGRVRAMARLCAAAYVEQREKLGFPLLKGENK